MFSSVTHLTVLVLWYGTCPILQEKNCEGTILFSSFYFILFYFILFYFILFYFISFYFIIIICNCLPGVPKSDSRPAWRLRRIFISSVEDAVLERSAALVTLCYGIGFGRLGRSPIFYCFTYVCYVIVVVLPLGG